MRFITFYERIGSRLNGSFLVEAENKREANKKVRVINRNFTRVHSLTLKEWCEDGNEVAELESKVLDSDDMYFLEEGT